MRETKAASTVGRGVSTREVQRINGNLTYDGTSTYTWNARGQLTTIAAGATTTASFGYDPLGRRVARTISGATTGFAYNGSTAVQEKSGSSVTANSIVGGTDQVFSRTDSAGARSFLTDGLGSTLALADTSGAVQTSYAYTPYGATTTTGAASTNAVQYSGRENDANGLYYYRARYYNPTTGRFISEDPLGLAAGINIYAYAADDPVDLNDPSGMFVNLAAGCVAGVVMSVAVDLVTAIGNWLTPNFSVGGVPLAKRKITLGGMIVDAAIGCALGALTMGVGELVNLLRPAGEGLDILAEDPLAGATCSFSGDTLVSASSGEVPISSLKPGSTVYGYDPGTGSVGSHAVTAVSKHLDMFVEDLKLSNGSVETTPNHRFFTLEHGWTTAGSLHRGDHILTQSGSTTTVSGFTIAMRPTTMYDLTVAGVHDFFVGPGQWLVHNCDLHPNWESSTFDSAHDSFEYHYQQHGEPFGRTVSQYASDSENWAASVRGTSGTSVRLGDGSIGTRYQSRSGWGGILDSAGKIVTFWYEP